MEIINTFEAIARCGFSQRIKAKKQNGQHVS